MIDTKNLDDLAAQLNIRRDSAEQHETPSAVAMTMSDNKVVRFL